MRGRGSLLVPVILLLAAVAMAGDVPEPAGGDGDRPQAEVAGQRGWLRELLHRFFGRAPQEGDELAGRAEVLVDRYVEHAGKRIEVVIVQPVLRFEDPPDTSAAGTTAWLQSLASRFRSYTREHVVRDFLTFRRGDTLEPLALGESERLVRQLDFINDARIIVLPLGPDGESVAVVVEYRDRWPLGVTAVIKTADRYDAGIYTTNLAGEGIRFDNRLIVNRADARRRGYAGEIARQNLWGSFVDGKLNYEDSWQKLSRRFQLRRTNRHAGIRWVGGVTVRDEQDRQDEIQPRRFDETDLWLGRVLPIARERALRSGAVRSLTPAVSTRRLAYTDRPAAVGPDTLDRFHGGRRTLGGLTYELRRDVKTSYLFRMGEAEDLPRGMYVKLSAGYDDGEFDRRTAAAVEAVGLAAAARGDVTFGRVAYGGFWREGRFEDGVLDAELFRATPLLGRGRFTHRLYLDARYTFGINRRRPNGLRLGNRWGIRDLPDSGIYGDQRLVTRLEWRMFSPWHLLGFRIMTFVFVDAGLIGSSKDPIFEQKLYTSLGGGVRLNNPDLVLPTFELRFGAVQNIDDAAFAFAFDLGNLSYPDIEVPGAKPGLVLYD